VTVRIRVVLVEPEHEGNIGSIARVMKNFDLKDLWLVKPKVTLGLESSLYAVNAQEVLSSSKIVSTLKDALAHIDFTVGTTGKAGWSTRNVLRTPIDPKLLSKQIIAKQGRVALLFGRESKGLTNRELNLCDVLVTIPTSTTYRTLNVAAAAGIIFYELFVSTLKASSLRKTEARGLVLQRVEDYFEEICRELELTPHKEEITIRAFRNVLHRGYVSQREASLLIGAMRRASRKIKTEG
jgi:tRNA/rRNA methyltransferase